MLKRIATMIAGGLAVAALAGPGTAHARTGQPVVFNCELLEQSIEAAMHNAYASMNAGDEAGTKAWWSVTNGYIRMYVESGC
jgi:hypothetical protein